MKLIEITIVALLMAALFWIGLSPRVAGKLYTSALFGLGGPCKKLSNHPLVGKGEAICFSGHDETMLRGMFYKHPTSKLLCIYSMGRQSNLSKGAENSGVMLAAGASVFVFEYRGFGETFGAPALERMFQDELCAVDYATNTMGYGARDIVLYGESMGGLVASYVCSQREVGGLVLQSVPISLESVAKHIIPPVRLYPSWSFPSAYRFASTKFLASRKTMPPLLVIHGCKDGVVPLSHSVQNYEAAEDEKFLVHLPNGDHGSLAVSDGPLYLQALTNFFALVGKKDA
jgi:alpha-beta hydrolase superfamily lysophospholipase